MLLLEYYDQWADRMDDYLNGIQEDLDKGLYRADHVQAVGTIVESEDLTITHVKQEANDKICIHELQIALLPIFYGYIHECKATQEIWNTLKEKFEGNEHRKKSLVTQCLFELANFKQKETKSTKAYYNHFKYLIYKCSRYNVIRSVLEFNITFILCLRKEQKNICFYDQNSRELQYLLTVKSL